MQMPSGCRYVADGGTHAIHHFKNEGAFIKDFGGVGGANGQFRQPYSVAVDGDGNIYVADYGNDRIQKFSPNGRFLLQWSTGRR